MQLVAILKLIITYLPLIIELIKTIEKQFPEAGLGKFKLETIRGMLEASFDAAGDFNDKFDDVWPVLEKTITKVVSFMNAAGLFKKA